MLPTPPPKPNEEKTSPAPETVVTGGGALNGIEQIGNWAKEWWNKQHKGWHYLALFSLGVIGIYANFRGAFENNPLVENVRCLAGWDFRNEIQRQDARRVFDDYGQALNFARNGEWEIAEQKLLLLRELKLPIPLIRSSLAGVYLERGNLEAADEALQAELAMLDCLSQRSVGQLNSLVLFDKRETPTEPEIRTLFQRARALTYYNLACLHATRRDPDKSLDALQKAIEFGYADTDQLGRDRFLASVRDLPRYERLLTMISH